MSDWKMNIMEEEYLVLQKTVEKLNAESSGVEFRLVEIKETYYIYPEFPARQ